MTWFPPWPGGTPDVAVVANVVTVVTVVGNVSPDAASIFSSSGHDLALAARLSGSAGDAVRPDRPSEDDSDTADGEETAIMGEDTLVRH